MLEENLLDEQQIPLNPNLNSGSSNEDNVHPDIAADAEFARNLQEEEWYGAVENAAQRQVPVDPPLNNENVNERVRSNMLRSLYNLMNNSRFLTISFAFYGALELFMTIVMVIVNADFECHVPMRMWVMVFSARFLITVPLQVLRFQYPERDELYLRLLNWFYMIVFVWWIYGQLWVFRATECSGSLRTYCLVLIFLFYTGTFLPILVILGFCFCAPIVLFIFRRFNRSLNRSNVADLRLINRLPTCEWRPGRLETQCSICINNYSESEIVKILPCGHSFHRDCIDHWLQIKSICPLCRNDIRDTTLDGEESV